MVDAKKPAKAPAKAPAKVPRVADSAAEAGDIVDDVLAGIRKETGAESAMRMSDPGMGIKIRGVISTGCVALDAAIGRGGIPRSRLTIFHGAEGSGKTTLALQTCAETQRMGGVVIYIDKEYKLDPDYAVGLGVDLDRVIMCQPQTLEQSFSITEGAIKRAARIRTKDGLSIPILVVLDSMNAAITKAQFEGEWDAAHMAPQARCFSASLPKIIPQVHKEDVALCWISQVRQKMNVTFGNDEDIAGGKAPRFYASLIVHVKRIGTVKDGEDKTGNVCVAECRKNQISAPFKKANFVIMYGKGVDNERSLIEVAATADVLEKSGAWYSWNGERLGQGLANAAAALRERPELFGEIAAALKEQGVL